ncbi:hypothetical protein [Chitinivorax sp. B]|uniref:hypothetical protein n=1 Tax=Chitinivorax sp. B TaxID=2502235 RepID=UPI0010F567F0|nr:hypothetical protein [Chitinivorax sp. B]
MAESPYPYTDNNGYPMVVGMDAAQKEDMVRLGTERLQQMAADTQPASSRKHPDSALLSAPLSTLLPCPEKHQGVCLQTWQTQTETVAHTLTQHAEWLEQYRLLSTQPHFSSDIRITISDAKTPAYSFLVAESKLHHAAIAQHNYLGKILASASHLSFNNHYRNIIDLKEQIRVNRAQLLGLTLAQTTPAALIALGCIDPYTRQPLQWDATIRNLAFSPRQENFKQAVKRPVRHPIHD